MSQIPEEKGPRPATERAEELLDRAGRRLGLFIASAGQRVQRTAAITREKAEQRNSSLNGKKVGRRAATGEETSQEAMERAEELVGQVEQRLRHFASMVGFNVQKTTARMREEAEDMWAEAQHIRSQSRRKPQ
ncbi:MAG TPA: hypothetical protein VKV19_05600 [Ktedonobacteraceae bacterium]|nr:hypothetical protein [Ktedonobacteraceae bacterium]